MLPFLFSLLLCQTWRQHQEKDPWPGRRDYHIAACLGYGGQHQRLLISGGGDDVGRTYDDMWLMDPQSGKMEELRTALYNLSYSYHNEQYKITSHVLL